MRLHSRRRIPRRDRAAANRRAGTFGPVRHAAGQVVDSSRKLKESEDQPSLSFLSFSGIPGAIFALIGYGFHQLADLFGIAQKVIFHQT